MGYTIAFSDVDGTLLDHNRELSAYTIAEIKRISQHIPFVLISSRMPSAMSHLQKSLGIEDTPLICYNGGLILINGQVAQSTTIPIQIIEELIDFNTKDQVHLSLYHNDEWYVPQDDFWANRERQNTKVTPTIKANHIVLQEWKQKHKSAHKIMCMGEESAIDRLYDFMEKNFSTELHLYRSKPTYIEIAEKSISKKTAIQHLLDQHFNLKVEDAVAFGDNYNDIEMIQFAGTGVAVKNAKPETIAVADYVTANGKEDGVAEFINKHIIF
ncbi:Cof-type HAD-IIB family hydrolase [Aquimarina brevivitae]|uniref:Cof subfamily protein (Haloacid dehalogenase superfamily)/HAD superfamily hydrolase (TIGR01484 family) n=1 Tax=Aquimarina brevivitae TaxID=323412 RepID=A0A4Q7P011_9FLAO|nr:Cof-type HAD-IIB family hydrolase [Aquimarina brevivitae]RZS93111.1 hypothetical protein EV197_1681 [Aquimarina brevivitae]